MSAGPIYESNLRGNWNETTLGQASAQWQSKHAKHREDVGTSMTTGFPGAASVPWHRVKGVFSRAPKDKGLGH
jgi:hypothetical protein